MSRNKDIEMMHNITGRSYKECRALLKANHWQLDSTLMACMGFDDLAKAFDDLAKVFDDLAKTVADVMQPIVKTIAEVMAEVMADQNG